MLFLDSFQQANGIEPTAPHHSPPSASGSLLQQTWAHQVSPLHVFVPLQQQRVWLICTKPSQRLRNTDLYFKSHWQSCGRVVTWYPCPSLFPLLEKKLAPIVCRSFFTTYILLRDLQPNVSKIAITLQSLKLLVTWKSVTAIKGRDTIKVSIIWEIYHS